jgi:iron complex outermembrane receptor protein
MFMVRYALLCGISALVLAGGAHAADGDAVDQIVVTGLRPVQTSSAATKTSTPIIETPQSISVISAGQIDAQGAQTLGEALRYVAGVNPEQYGGLDQRLDWYMIRGFPTSFSYIDGLSTNSRYTLLAPKIDPYGLQQIEVLRGPSSVLYGQNIPGGLISAISRRPQETAAGEVAIQTGSYGRIEGRFDATGPLDDDGTLLYRVTGLALRTGTQIDHVTNHHYLIAPALTWQPDASTRITLLTHFQRQKDGFALQNLPAAGTLYPSSLGKVPTSLFTGEPALNHANRTQWDIGYDAEHHFSDDWSIHQNLRFAHIRATLGYVAGYAQEEDNPALMDRFALNAWTHQNNLAVDTHVEGHVTTGSVQHTLLIGIDTSRSHDKWSEEDGSAEPLDITHPVYGGPIAIGPDYLDFVTDDTIRQTGLYAQDQMKLDRLVLTGSIRQDWAATRTFEHDVYANQDLRQHDKAFTGRGGIVYVFDNGLAPYASYSTSFQPTVGTTFDGTPLKPTTAIQWEVGVKYQPKGAKSFLMLSAYDLKERNVTTADPDPLHPNSVVQTGGARVRGIEASGNLDLGHGFSSTVAYTYMAPKITTANDDTLGKRLMDVARNSASAWLDKAIALRSVDRLTLGGGVRYIGPRYGDNENTLRLPGNTQFDALVRYDLARWQLTLNARNLTDKRVVAQCDSVARCFYAERRSIIATLGYRW